MRSIFIFLCTGICICTNIYSQQTLQGIVYNDQGKPVEYATAALLNPSDSTLEFFGFTNATGNFAIKQVSSGNYLLQISFIGLNTYDTLITVPLQSENMGVFILTTQINDLGGVVVSGERTPLQIKGDTIEYNANAFKTQPDATAEDLLKKLPGIEVDKSGNVKAQGEDVQTVLVDGKEFFSTDPTVATKNLPADAIDKVQVYDKTSDDADFTGVDDGERSKTINLILKDGKKSMWLGDVTAGAGTENTYLGNAKAYRFTKTDQFAGLAMLNNINQFGFSVRDYIDFNGGFGNMMRGGGFRVGGDDVPVNFGQNVTGLITSGAGGLNYTHEKIEGNRFNMSYLGNGYEKDLVQNTFTQNFTPDFSFDTDEDLNQLKQNFAHRFNFNAKYKPDSMQSLNSFGNITMSYGNTNSDLITENFSSDSLTNRLISDTYEQSNSLKGSASLGYIHKTKTNWKYFRLNGSADIQSTLSNSNWNNNTEFFDTDSLVLDKAFQDGDNYSADYDGSFSGVRKLTDKIYIEPVFAARGVYEKYSRSQGNPETNEEIDSLSPSILRENVWIEPGIKFKYNTKKTQLRIKFAVQNLVMTTTQSEIQSPQKSFLYFTPSVEFDHEIKNGRHIRSFYHSSVTAPSAVQLLPVADYSDPLFLYFGNPELEPEYKHSLNFNYLLFDEFSFTSLFVNAGASYTFNKINYKKTIHEDLSQEMTFVNTPYDISANGGFNLSTPVRPLKINSHLSFSENFSRGINEVNEEENIIDAFTHSVTVSFDNRKKKKIDASVGATYKFTQSNYSIQSDQNSTYITETLFSEVDYNPDSLWRISFQTDIDRYEVEGFGDPQTVPLLQAQITRFLFKGNRAAVSLIGYDLLDKNSGFTQSSAYNYVRQQQTNSIGRYFMLTFKFRINKADTNNGVSVEVNGKK